MHPIHHVLDIRDHVAQSRHMTGFLARHLASHSYQQLQFRQTQLGNLSLQLPPLLIVVIILEPLTKGTQQARSIGDTLQQFQIYLYLAFPLFLTAGPWAGIGHINPELIARYPSSCNCAVARIHVGVERV